MLLALTNQHLNYKVTDVHVTYNNINYPVYIAKNPSPRTILTMAWPVDLCSRTAPPKPDNVIYYECTC